MSDFDKEAERERLREKYEQDQQKRAASERMSDLLLKGATMTNAHCNECGDPIFRYDGEEFCPTCQRVVTNDEAAEQAADAEQGDPTDDASGQGQQSDEVEQTPEENGDSPAHIEIKQPDGPAVQTGGTQQEAPSGAGGQSQPAGADDAPAAEPGESASASNQSVGTEEPSSNASVSGGTSAGLSDPDSSITGDAAAPAETGGDFDAARASLVRTLRKHAERAESTDDPRRARDHLAAAREAAEALDALSAA